MVRLHRAVFGGDRGAFDQGEQVALHAFAGDAAAAHVTHRDLVHLIQEHDAVGFGVAHGFALDLLVIEALVRLFGQQRLPGGVHLHLAALGAAAHRLGHHVRKVDHADLAGLHAGHFEAGRRVGHLDLDLTALQIAGFEALAEGKARGFAGILAHQRIKQAGECGVFRLVLHGAAAGFADEADRFFDEITDDRIDVAANIANFGELGGFHLDERGVGEASEAAADLGLAAAGGADHQDILGHHFVAQIVGQLLPAPAVAQGHGNGALGIILPDDVAIQCGDDLAGGQIGAHRSIDSTVSSSLV